MNAQQQARAAVVSILIEDCKINGTVITDDAHLQDDLGLDSMTLLSLALEAENFIGCALDEDPENPPMTIRELGEMMALRMEEQRNVA
jgi:acyl carrier protein